MMYFILKTTLNSGETIILLLVFHDILRKYSAKPPHFLPNVCKTITFILETEIIIILEANDYKGYESGSQFYIKQKL